MCDPVQGDNGQVYVSKDLLPAFRDQLVPIATVVTPNQFEMELLTGRSIASVASALEACQELHHRGPRTVVRRWGASPPAPPREGEGRPRGPLQACSRP